MNNIDDFTKELNSRMGQFIAKEHVNAPEDPALRSQSMGVFKSELKQTIFSLIDEKRIVFSHDVEVGNFMKEINPSVNSLLDSFIAGK